MNLGLGLGLTASRPSKVVKNYTLTSALPSGATFTRASSGTRVNASGVVVTETTNAPRFDYNPATLAALGIYIGTPPRRIFSSTQKTSPAPAGPALRPRFHPSRRPIPPAARPVTSSSNLPPRPSMAFSAASPPPALTPFPFMQRSPAVATATSAGMAPPTQSLT